MSLLSLIGRKKLVLLGLNSGTSADGLDLAVVRISRRGTKIESKFIYGTVRSYPIALKQQLVEMADCQTTELEHIIALDRSLGIFFGQQARRVINKMNRQNMHIDLVASHGHTIRHVPRYFVSGKQRRSGSLQIGSLEQIATITSLPVVGDFRQADLAVGGEGAPITGLALKRLIGMKSESLLVVNIGGMSNYFYYPSEKSAGHSKSADCGPGNVLTNILSERLFQVPFDRGGKLAKRGKPSTALLSRLINQTTTSQKTCSTGREVFGPSLAELMIASKRELKLSNNDILSTATEFTAYSIAKSIKSLLARDDKVVKLYLTGGGRHNHYMLNRISDYLPGIEVLPIEAIGFNGDLVEAVTFAFLGEATLRSEPLASSRHEGRQPIGGRIVQPPLKRQR